MLRTPAILVMFAVAFGVLGLGLLLALHALSQGATPHLWVWGVFGVGALLLRAAVVQYRRRNSPRFWQRRRLPTGSSLTVRIIGLALIIPGVAMFARGEGALRVFGGALAAFGFCVIVASSLLMKRND